MLFHFYTSFILKSLIFPRFQVSFFLLQLSSLRHSIFDLSSVNQLSIWLGYDDGGNLVAEVIHPSGKTFNPTLHQSFISLSWFFWNRLFVWSLFLLVYFRNHLINMQLIKCQTSVKKCTIFHRSLVPFLPNIVVRKLLQKTLLIFSPIIEHVVIKAITLAIIQSVEKELFNSSSDIPLFMTGEFFLKFV